MDLFSNLFPSASGFLNSVNIAYSMSSNNSVKSNTNGDNYDNYGKKTLYSIDDADLPESTSESLAYTNDYDGVIAEFEYDSIYTGGYWSVTDKARILYRTYLNTNRTGSAWSGYAEKIHTVYGK